MAKKPYIPHSTPLEMRPRAIIIGASSGIGEALTLELAQEGYIVAIIARRLDVLKVLCEDINKYFGEPRAFAYPHDVTDFDSVPALFQKIHQDLRGIDLVVYSAGVMPAVAFSEYSFEKDKQMVDVHLLGAMAWLGQAAQLFERTGHGQIVGISSVAGDRGRVGNPGYHASKSGFTTYLESLRNRLSRSGVNVLTIKPGPVSTPMTAGMEMPFMAPVDQVARDIMTAIRKRRQTRYTPRRWWFIMAVVILIPSFIFRRLNF